MTFSTIRVDREGPAGIITLNRPEKYNAFSKELLAELSAAMGELEQDPELRGVVVTGSEKYFCTGADLNEAVAIKTPIDIMEYNRLIRRLSYQIEHLRKPVIAAISGYCLTGGLEMSLACDIRLGAENAKFGITSSKIGSVAGSAGIRLPRLVGTAIAKELLFTANFFDAAEAYRIGLVNRVVPVGTVVDAAREMIDIFAQRGPLSIAWMKLAVNIGMRMDLESALDYEAALSAEAFVTPDKEEGMRAFLEKRTAVFQGR